MRPVVRRLLNARAASVPALSPRSISSRSVLTIANSRVTARAGPALQPLCLRRGSAVVRGRGLSTSGGDGNKDQSLKIAVLASLLAVVALDDGTIFYTLVDRVGMPLLRLLDPEDAHDWAIKALATGWMPRNHCRWGDKALEGLLAVEDLWGLHWPSVVGIAAGFDKHAAAMQGLLDLGAGFVEVGSITPQPQPGNPKPRMFRLVEDRGVINRYGFNSEGMHAAQARLQAYRSQEEQEQNKSKSKLGLIGVNAGKNRNTEEAQEDYRAVADHLGPYADYLVINVSSPNTPGLRALQQAQAMKHIINTVQESPALQSNYRGVRVPVLVKVAPDLTDTELDNIARVVLETKVDGLIVSNTTITRPDSLKSVHRGEVGGLSGAPVRDLSTAIIRELYTRTEGRVPIIGVGGIGSGQEAYDKIKAGASLVQVYSMLVYEGPGSIRRIKEELAALLRKDGYRSVTEAVGTGVVLPPPNAGKNPRILAIDEMRHLSTYLLLKLGGNDNPTAADVTTALSSVGVDVDSARLTQLMKELEGKDVDELIKSGTALLAKFGGGGGGGAAPAAAEAAPDAKEGKKKEEKKEEEEMDLGAGMSMFGGGGDGY